MSDLREAELTFGPQSIQAYRRLSYTLWYALAEFIDNSTQSRQNYGHLIDDVLSSEGSPLVVSITYNRLTKSLEITDNSIGMSYETLVNALRVAQPTKDSLGRSKYGLGLKTAACWLGAKWTVRTCEWSSGVDLIATVDVDAIAAGNTRIPIVEVVHGDKARHGTTITIESLHRVIQRRTEANIRLYLGSMYRFDLAENRLMLLYNNERIAPPDASEWDTDTDGKPLYRTIEPTVINGKTVKGWFGVLRTGGRKFGGFSLFQHQRQIQGFPNAWKPTAIFGGVDGEGANNLIAQRLTGLLELDDFAVSHTKDAIDFLDNEEEELEDLLKKLTTDFRTLALRTKKGDKQHWSPDKIHEMAERMKGRFSSPAMQDAVAKPIPPLSTILANSAQQVAALTHEEPTTTVPVSTGLKVITTVQTRSENDPYVTIAPSATEGTMHVIINGLHPYYSSIEVQDALEECIHQYILDAIATYRAMTQAAPPVADTVRRIKNDLLLAMPLREVGAAESVITTGRAETHVGEAP